MEISVIIGHTSYEKEGVVYHSAVLGNGKTVSITSDEVKTLAKGKTVMMTSRKIKSKGKFFTFYTLTPIALR